MTNDLNSLAGTALHCGILIEPIECADKLVDGIVRPAIGQTQRIGHRLPITLFSGLSEEEQSAAVDHEVIEGAMGFLRCFTPSTKHRSASLATISISGLGTPFLETQTLFRVRLIAKERIVNIVGGSRSGASRKYVLKPELGNEVDVRKISEGRRPYV